MVGTGTTVDNPVASGGILIAEPTSDLVVEFMHQGLLRCASGSLECMPAYPLDS